MMNEPKELHQLHLQGTLLTEISYSRDEDIASLNLHGDFNADEPEYRHYHLCFGKVETPLDGEALEAFADGTLKEITAEGEQDDFHIRLTLEKDGQKLTAAFTCCNFMALRLRYRGVDYTNIYDTEAYQAYREKFLYAGDETYFRGSELYELPDGYTLKEKVYSHSDEHRRYASLIKYHLKKDGETVFKWRSIYSHPKVFTEFIAHRDGHLYYPFHTDLYGISFLQLDTLKACHYIPKGYDTDYDQPYGESFIITDIHYNPLTNQVAYDGCYWGGGSEVMIGDLSDPLHFDPNLVSAYALLDPDAVNMEEIEDIDFVRWEGEKLVVSIDGTEHTLTLP